MQTDIAANSDSTLMYSHGASAPVFTSEDSPSTMWVCGEIGYAPITSGRHRATASATAREPSSCLSMSRLQQLGADVLERLLCSGRVGLADVPGETVPVRGGHGVDRYEAVQHGEPAEQRG